MKKKLYGILGVTLVTFDLIMNEMFTKDERRGKMNIE